MADAAEGVQAKKECVGRKLKCVPRCQHGRERRVVRSKERHVATKGTRSKGEGRARRAQRGQASQTKAITETKNGGEERQAVALNGWGIEIEAVNKGNGRWRETFDGRRREFEEVSAWRNCGKRMGEWEPCCTNTKMNRGGTFQGYFKT
ncbi:hypothetical protein SESBI_32857 [Sesbania bispinosa]|nr:hypothetical protein SESBI_32857 [Sesbania bispinosa]